MTFNPKAPKTILGIDPGTVVTGYGVLKSYQNRLELIDYGSIRPSNKLPLNQRYAIIFKGINDLLDKYQPDAVSVETQFLSKNIQVAIKLGMARGVITLASTLRGIPVFEYTPRKAKQAIVGNGGASKEQVQKMLKILLNLSEIPKPEDAADALSLALCHVHQLNSLEKIGI